MQEGFDALDTEERPWLLTMARRFCRGLANAEDLAQDLVQTTLVHYFNGYAKSEQIERGKRRALLVTILNNRFIDELRKQRRYSEVTRQLPTDSHDEPEPADKSSYLSITMEQLRQAIEGSLSPLLEETYLLHMRGKRNWEIAKHLAITEQSVAKRLHDARKKLRKYLQRFIN